MYRLLAACLSLTLSTPSFAGKTAHEQDTHHTSVTSSSTQADLNEKLDVVIQKFFSYEYENICNNQLALLINAAAEGHEIAKACLATLRYFKKYNDLTIDEAVDILTKITENEDTHSFFSTILGHSYRQGWKKEDDTRQAPQPWLAYKYYTKAIELYEKSPEKITRRGQKAHRVALTNLGTMERKGWQKKDGTQQSPRPWLAVEYYKKAVKEGGTTALAYLKAMYEQGWQNEDGTQQAPQPWLALECTQKEADKGIRRSIHNFNKATKFVMFHTATQVEKFHLSHANEMLDGDLEDIVAELLFFATSTQNDKFKDMWEDKKSATFSDLVYEELKKIHESVNQINEPGFLTTPQKWEKLIPDDQPKLAARDQMDTPVAFSEDDFPKAEPASSYIKTYDIEGKLFVCVGRENVAAADYLLNFIGDKPSIDSYLATLIAHYTDLVTPQEGQKPHDHAKVIKKRISYLTALEKQLSVWRDEIKETITENAASRNTIFQNKYNG